MGLLDSFEKGLERAVNSAFAKTFRSGIQPVEIASALRSELDKKAAVVSRDRILAPNTFTVRLSPADEEKMAAVGPALLDELDGLVKKHARAQGYSFAGAVTIELRRDESVSTGTLRVDSETAQGRVSWRAVVDVEGSQLVPRAADSSQPDLSLDVKLPLELKNFQARGLRQTADAVGGRQFTFTRFRADARLRVRTGLPDQSLSADVLTKLSRQQAGWNADVEIVWSANSGNTFLSRCLLAPHWKLVDLKPVSNTSRLEWRTVTRRDNRELLIVEWPDAIDSETPQAVLLQLGHSAGNLSPVDFPLLQPLDCEQHRQVLVLAEPSANDRLLARQGGPLEPVVAETLDDSWSGFSSFEATILGSIYTGLRVLYPVVLRGRIGRNIPVRILPLTFSGYIILTIFAVRIAMSIW